MGSGYRGPGRARSVRRNRVTAPAGRAGVVAALLVMLAAGLVATGPGGRAVASRRGAPASVVLRPGQTLWGLAERYAPPGVDPRAYVDALVEINDLDGVPQAGERLRLPG
jgi:hypothetical protein